MSDDNVENELIRLGQTWPDKASLLNRVMSRAAETRRATQPLKSRRAMRINAAVAAGIVACLGLWWAVSPTSPGSQLYAAMKEALERVDSFRVVTSIANDDGTLRPVSETWFQRNVGFAVDRPDVIRIDNGEFFWEYPKGGKTAVRRRSQDTNDLLDRAIGIKDELEQDCERFEAGDKTIDGLRLKCYQLTFHGGGRRPADPTLLDFSKRRTYVFVDVQSLVRRVESHESDHGEWRLKMVNQWEYNFAIDQRVFKPDFGEQVTIIDGDKAFEELTDVGKAIWSEERAGLIYTIHEAQLFEGGGVLVMSSVRGTDETLKKFPLERRMLQPGLYITDGPAVNYRASPQGLGYFRLSLATTQQSGVHVEWWMMVPRGRAPTWFKNDSGRVELALGMTPQGAYGKAQHADARGVIHHITWTQTVDLPKPQPLPALSALVEHIFQTISLLPPVPGTILDMGVKEVGGEPQGQRAAPQDVTSQQFVDAVYDHWRWWEANDVEFQLTTGVRTTNLPVADRDYPIPPSISVSYYSVVDDRTLNRAAQNPELERLWISGTRITDNGLAALSHLEHLSVLDISDTEVSDAGLRHLETIGSLKSVTANQTNVSQEGVKRLQQLIPGLEVKFSNRAQ